MKLRYLLDTHSLVFAAYQPERLGAKARRAIESAAKGELAFSAATMIELGRLIDEDQIDLHGRKAEEVFATAFAHVHQVPVSLSAAIKAPVLGLPHADPFDRLIVATALDLGVPLITKDGNITDSGVVRVVW